MVSEISGQKPKKSEKAKISLENVEKAKLEPGAGVRFYSIGMTKKNETSLKLGPSSKIKTDLLIDGEINYGSLNFTGELKMHSSSKTSLIINMSKTSYENVMFKNMIKLVEKPISMVCANNQFNCNQWKMKVESDDKSYPIPKYSQSCAWNDNQYCLRFQLDELPVWLEELYCVSNSEQCDGYLGAKIIKLDDISETLKGIHPRTKNVKLIFDLDMGNDDLIDLNNLPSNSYNMMISSLNTSIPKNISLNLLLNDPTKINQLILENIHIKYNNQSQSTSINFPYFIMKDVIIDDNLLLHSFNFEKVNLTLNSYLFSSLKNSVFKNIDFIIDDDFNQLYINENNYFLKFNENEILSVSKNQVKGIIGINYKMNGNLSLNMNSTSNIFNGLNINIINQNINKQYSLIFNGNWDLINNFENEFHISNSIPLYIESIPGKLPFTFSGSGNVYMHSLAESLNIRNLNQVAKIKQIQIVNSQPIELESLSFDIKDNTKFEMKNNNNQPNPTSIKQIKIKERTRTKIGNITILGNITLESFSSLEVDEIHFENSIIGAKLLSTLPTLDFNFKFEEDGIPKILVTEDMISSGIPDIISVIYNASTEENEFVDFSLWVDNPQTILYGTGFDCDQWKNLVQFDSLCPSITKDQLKMTTICNPYEDFYNEGYIALQIYLISEPISSTPTESETSNDLLGPILIGSGVVSTIGIIYSVFKYFGKKEVEGDTV